MVKIHERGGLEDNAEVGRDDKRTLQEVRECIAWEELARPLKFSLAGNAEAIATATEKEGAALRSLLPATKRIFLLGGNLAVARILADLTFALENIHSDFIRELVAN